MLALDGYCTPTRVADIAVAQKVMQYHNLFLPTIAAFDCDILLNVA
jgi:hypothetical protein